jgi:hypothetical protein
VSEFRGYGVRARVLNKSEAALETLVRCYCSAFAAAAGAFGSAALLVYAVSWAVRCYQ